MKKKLSFSILIGLSLFFIIVLLFITHDRYCLNKVVANRQGKSIEDLLDQTKKLKQVNKELQKINVELSKKIEKLLLLGEECADRYKNLKDEYRKEK